MNLDALSDLVLALACAWVFTFKRGNNAGMSVASLLMGLAACLGVLRFSGLALAYGPHRFASLVAACAAFPLLAVSLGWAEDAMTARWTAAARFALLSAALGVALTVWGVTWWSQLVPGLSALVILAIMFRPFNIRGLIGALLLLAGLSAAAFLGANSIHLGFLSRIQVLHYFLAAAWVALALAPARYQLPRDKQLS